jgi:hypothetical protein
VGGTSKDNNPRSARSVDRSDRGSRHSLRQASPASERSREYSWSGRATREEESPLVEWWDSLDDDSDSNTSLLTPPVVDDKDDTHQYASKWPHRRTRDVIPDIHTKDRV